MILKDLGGGWSLELNDRDGDVELRRRGQAVAWISGGVMPPAADYVPAENIAALVDVWKARQVKP